MAQPPWLATCKCANSAPPSLDSAKRAHTKNAKQIDNNSDKSDADCDGEVNGLVCDDEGKENGQDNEDEQESEDEDPVARYNWMAEEIQHECKVCFIFLLWLLIAYLHIQAPQKHNHWGHNNCTRDLQAMFTKATKEDGKVLNGHICNFCQWVFCFSYFFFVGLTTCARSP